MKKQLVLFFYLVALGILVSSCTPEPEDETITPNPSVLEEEENEPDPNMPEWLIPQEEVRDGGPGKDGIPSIDLPVFTSIDEIDFLQENDLVIGIKKGDEIRAYPHPILDWHEIVNDKIGEEFIAITYCPLTGTAIGWDRNVNGQVTTFGVSGLLYNSNLIPYDRATNSNWSQMRLDCVNGPRASTKIQTHQVIETTWATWKTWFPESKVLTRNTGFDRSYDQYPYGSYKTNEDLIFNVNPDDSRLHKKERVLGVIVAGEVKAYRFRSFEKEDIIIKTDNFFGEKYIIVGSKKDNFLVAFNNPDRVPFEVSDNYPKSLLTDDEGNEWNIFGEAISGPKQGQKLSPMESYIGYWFAWGAFYADTVIN